LPVRLGSGRATSLSPDGRWALTIPLDQANRVDMLPTGAGEPRRIEIPGDLVHEWATWLGGGAGILVQTVDPKTGLRSIWRTEADGSSPRSLVLPDGASLSGTAFHPGGERYVRGCSKDKAAEKEKGSCCFEARPCVVDLRAGTTALVRGAEPLWIPVGWDAKDRLYFRFRDGSAGQPGERLYRVDLATGRAERLDELAPRDRAGVMGLSQILVAANAEAWAYTAIRRLSDLFVVTNVS